MRYGRYGLSYIILRLSLGLVFIWIGIDMFRHADSWIGYLPETIPLGISRTTALQLTAVFDTTIGLLLLFGHFSRLVSLLIVVHLTGIIAINGLDQVLIRNVGLLGSALALLLWPYHRRRHWLPRIFTRRGNSEYQE